MKLFLATALSLAMSVSHAYTYVQVGVDSNFLIDGNRVLFAQADGSLTELALDTGQVVRREKGRDFSGTLKRIPEGILQLQYNTIALLNPTNLTVIWETQSSYAPNVLSNSLVSYDGNGLVERRNLSDGTVRWRLNLPGALEVIAEAGKVLVHRAATYEKDAVPTTVLLDLETGQELFRKIPASGVHWEAVFFDGHDIYVEQGSFAGKRSDYHLENLLVWDEHGEEIASFPLEQSLRDNLRFGGGEPFTVDHKTFLKGHVYAQPPPSQDEWMGTLLTTDEQPVGPHEIRYELADGAVFVERTSNEAENQSSRMEIELRTAGGHWAGSLPYLANDGRISAIASAPGKLLIGSNLGHVECIRAETGESLWLYVFPTIRQTMSFSSPFGLPPMYSQAAATFRKENSTPPTSGLRLPDQHARPVHVILDPAPVDPFADLPRVLLLAWGGAMIPLSLLFFLHAHPRTRRANLAMPVALLLVIPFFCFLAIGRVSPGSSIALRLAIISALCFGIFDTVRSLRRRQWFSGIALAGTILAVTWLMLPFLYSFVRAF